MLCGARTRACRVETPLDTSAEVRHRLGTERRQEWRRGTHECVRHMTERGRFITFEGPEGSGKSTQLRMLGERLRKAGRDVLETQEPGGTPIGVQIRHVLLDSKNHELCATAELLLMFASRAQNVDQLILPALSAGRTVLSDRFTDSTLVYQGVGRGLGAEVVYELDRIACRGLVPDLTLVIDIDAETGLERARR